MKYFVSLLIISALALDGTAQSKFSVGAFISPELCTFNSFMGQRPDFNFGYTGGFQVRYHVSPKIHLHSGIQYSSKGLAISLVNYDQNGFAYGTSRANFNFRFWEVPVLLSYSSNPSSRLSFYASAGLIPGYLISERASIPDGMSPAGVSKKIYVFNRHDLNSGYKKMVLNGFIGIGGTINLSEKISLLIQPNFKYALTSINKPLDYLSYPPSNYKNYHPYSFGLISGVFYKF